MKSKDAKMLEEAYENIFAGIVDDDKKEDKDDESSEKDEHKDSDEESKSEKKVDKDEPDDDASDDEKEDHEESESDDEEKEESDSDDSDDDDKEKSDDDGDDESEGGEDGEAGGDKGVQSKIQTLQKQYNDIMQDAFTKYAPDCIEDALNSSEGAFGEDIEGVLQTALDGLKTKILGDFGIESAEGDIELDGSMSPDIAGRAFGGMEDEGDEISDISSDLPDVPGGMRASVEDEEEEKPSVIKLGNPMM
jgi:hypothetical protein